MANLTPQLVSGRNLPTLAAANAGGDVTVLDRRIKLFVTNGGGGAIDVTVTPVGPYIRDAAARVYNVLAGQSMGLKVWDQPACSGRPDMGLANITYSGVTTVTVGAAFVEGG